MTKILPRRPLVVGAPEEQPAPAADGTAAGAPAGYLSYVRAQGCCAPLCGSSRSVAMHAHHYPTQGAGNHDDRRTVPLCALHHAEVHASAALVPFDAAATRLLFTEVQLRLLIAYLDRGGCL